MFFSKQVGKLGRFKNLKTWKLTVCSPAAKKQLADYCSRPDFFTSCLPQLFMKFYLPKMSKKSTVVQFLKGGILSVQCYTCDAVRMFPQYYSGLTTKVCMSKKCSVVKRFFLYRGKGGPTKVLGTY